MQSGRAVLGKSESVLLAFNRVLGGDKGASGGGFAEWVVCGGGPRCEFTHNAGFSFGVGVGGGFTRR
jgi:hypothetical protein